jgi:hypothetical protein
MTLLVVFASIIIFKIWVDYRYRFLILLCAVLIVSDLSTGILAVTQWFENSPVKHYSMEPGLVITVGIADFGCEGGSLLLHWMFSFKYWVISLEIPKAIQTSANQFNQVRTSIKCTTQLE